MRSVEIKEEIKVLKTLLTSPPFRLLDDFTKRKIYNNH